MKQPIETDTSPTAIGPYSQAVRAGDTLYISGQIPLNPASMIIISDDIDEQINQVLDNLLAILETAGITFDHVVKFTVYLTDLEHFSHVNDQMEKRLTEPYPARAAIEVAGLPRGAQVEIDAIAHLS